MGSNPILSAQNVKPRCGALGFLYFAEDMGFERRSAMSANKREARGGVAEISERR